MIRKFFRWLFLLPPEKYVKDFPCNNWAGLCNYWCGHCRDSGTDDQQWSYKRVE